MLFFSFIELFSAICAFLKYVVQYKGLQCLQSQQGLQGTMAKDNHAMYKG